MTSIEDTRPPENRGYPFELSRYIKTHYDAKRGVTSRVLKSALRRFDAPK